MDPNKPPTYPGTNPYPQPGFQPGYAPQQQPGYMPPQQGFPPQQQGFAPQPYPVQPTNPQVVVMGTGNCPSCRVGILSEDFTCCGILLAILFFPIGILCCLVMKDKRCTNCGATF